MYQYKFLNGCYPTAVLTANEQQPGYIVFGDGSAVDWTNKYYDGSSLRDAVYNYEVAADGNATFTGKGVPMQGCVQSAASIDICSKIHINGVWIDRPAAAVSLDDLKTMKYADIRARLAATDYECLKFVDGVLTAEEYTPTKIKREKLRDAFNAIQLATTINAVNAVVY